MKISNNNGYSLNAVIGMLVLGFIFTGFGLVFTASTLFKGKIVVVTQQGAIIKEKIKDLYPLRFNYFYALVFTLMFGPGLLLIGIISLTTFIVTQLF